MVVVQEEGKFYHLIVDSPKGAFDVYVDSYENTKGRIKWTTKTGEGRDYPEHQVGIETISKKDRGVK